MSDSTTNLDTISAAQASKEVTANALFDAGSPATLFGRRATTTTGLTWGYYGGKKLKADGTIATIANGTVALTNGATNYVYATDAGVVTVTTSAPGGWPAPLASDAVALYQIVTSGGLVTSYTDYRVSGGGGGAATGLIDGDYGDITVSGSGATMSVDSNAINYAKMQDVSATKRVIGRNTAGSGDPEEVTVSQLLDWAGTAAQGDILYRASAGWSLLPAGTSGHFLKTQGTGADPTWAAAGSGTVTTTGSPADGNLAKFSGAATITNGDLSGDVTTSGTLAATIANDAVTYAKMQNVSAASKLLGRGDSGSGDVQEITIGSGLTMTGTTISASGGGGTPGGSDTQVQFNDGGSFGGDGDFTWDKTNNILYIGGPGTIQGAAVGSTSTGNLVTIKGGNGGSTSGNAAGVTVTGGTPVDGNGGGVTLTGTNGVGTSKSGGAISITAGNGTSNVSGATVTISGGTGAGSGAGGAVTITGGGAATTGNGGTVTLQGTNGGDVIVHAGDSGTGVGTLTLSGGICNGTGGAGGTATLHGGDGDKGGVAAIRGGNGSAGNNGTGGNVTITGGTGSQSSFPGTAAPGTVSITGGTPSGDNNSSGGAVSLTGGPGPSYGSTTGDGGAATVAGGAANANNRDGGNVLLKGGAPHGTGDRGQVAVENGGALATTSTGGFFCIPTCAGAPTGTPANVPSGSVALVFDSTNNKLYIYDGSWLSTPALT